MSSVFERRHRLPPEVYRGQILCAFTANVRNRFPLFRDETVVRQALISLQAESAKRACVVPVYCFMPDHVHLILSGREATSDLKKAMDGFKREIGLWVGRNRPGVRMQKVYYDHMIRDRVDYKKQVHYAILNPVRRGLVEDWREYPYTGSLGCSLDEELFGLLI